MIVQTSPGNVESAPVFVMKNTEHAAFAAALAARFGNARFTRPEPWPEMLRLVAHHDDGWMEIDAEPPLDDRGLPFNLIETPFRLIIDAGRRSPAINEQYSPLCGLVSSMHTCGLYNGRYGLSQAIALDRVPAECRDDVARLLAQEQTRQQRLRSALADRSGIDDTVIWQIYKFLQFCDSMALFFNMRAAGDRGQSIFSHVPTGSGEDVDITIREGEPGRYRVAPYPFTREPLRITFRGRHVRAGSSWNDSDGVSAAEQAVSLSAA